MIRRNVEYVICCDSERLLGDACRSSGGWNAFSDLCRESCEAGANKRGWLQVTKRYWLCPACAKKWQERQVPHASP